MTTGTRKETVNSGVLYIRNLPRETKRAFKAMCVRRGVTMEAAVSKLISDYVATGVVK